MKEKKNKKNGKEVRARVLNKEMKYKLSLLFMIIYTFYFYKKMEKKWGKKIGRKRWGKKIGKKKMTRVKSFFSKSFLM